MISPPPVLHDCAAKSHIIIQSYKLCHYSLSYILVFLVAYDVIFLLNVIAYDVIFLLNVIQIQYIVDFF